MQQYVLQFMQRENVPINRYSTFLARERTHSLGLEHRWSPYMQVVSQTVAIDWSALLVLCIETLIDIRILKNYSKLFSQCQARSCFHSLAIYQSFESSSVFYRTFIDQLMKPDYLIIRSDGIYSPAKNIILYGHVQLTWVYKTITRNACIYVAATWFIHACVPWEDVNLIHYILVVGLSTHKCKLCKLVSLGAKQINKPAPSQHTTHSTNQRFYKTNYNSHTLKRFNGFMPRGYT